MRYITPAVLLICAALAAPAQETPAADEGETAMPEFVEGAEVELTDFLWKNRPIVVFADSTEDPAFQEQMRLLHAREDALAERDVVVITDTDPSVLSPLRKKLRPRGFMLVLIGKDGGIKQRKPFPWDVRELSRAIDKMPMRQREIRNGG